MIHYFLSIIGTGRRQTEELIGEIMSVNDGKIESDDVRFLDCHHIVILTPMDPRRHEEGRRERSKQVT